jgi:hypothetical protein
MHHGEPQSLVEADRLSRVRDEQLELRVDYLSRGEDCAREHDGRTDDEDASAQLPDSPA